MGGFGSNLAELSCIIFPRRHPASNRDAAASGRALGGFGIVLSGVGGGVVLDIIPRRTVTLPRQANGRLLARCGSVELESRWRVHDVGSSFGGGGGGLIQRPHCFGRGKFSDEFTFSAAMALAAAAFSAAARTDGSLEMPATDKSTLYIIAGTIQGSGEACMG